MAAFFTNQLKTALATDQTVMDGQQVKLVLFRYAPSMGSIDPTWTAARTVVELVATNPGWVEATGIGGYPLTLTINTNTRILPAGAAAGIGSCYVMYTDYKFAGLTQTAEVRAIGVVRVAPLNGVNNPLLFVTNTPIGDVTNLAPGDALTSAPDSTFPDNTNRWLFGWSRAAPDPVEGKLLLSRGSPAFEVSGSQHVWMFPQRANMIANPNFEAPGMNLWSTNGTLTRVSGTAPGSASIHGWAGSCSRSAATSSVYLNGTSNTHVEGPDLSAVGGATTFVVEVECSLDDWTPATGAILASQTVPGSYAWQLYASSFLQFIIYPTGTGTTLIYTSSVSHGLVDGSKHTIQATWTAVSGANSTVQFKVDGVVLGAVRVQASVPGGLFNSTATIRIGNNGNNSGSWMAGNVYKMTLTANGAVVASPDFTNMVTGQPSVTDAQGNVWALQGAALVANSAGALVMESNLFPTRMGDIDSEQWTVQLMAKGTGTLKVGLVYWNVRYSETLADWGDDESYVLSPDSWTHITTHRHVPEAHLAMVRLELQGTGLTIDNVLAERGYLKDWPYFDGDEVYGARDDFSWYGGTTRRGASYSLWYGLRKAVTGRLFARTVDPNDPSANVTDEDMEEQGLVYRWVPAGITVVPHLDVLYAGDVQNPVPAKAAGVSPYYSAGTPSGVVNPW